MSDDTMARWEALRAAPGPVDPAELDALWADLEVVAASALACLRSSRGHFSWTGPAMSRPRTATRASPSLL